MGAKTKLRVSLDIQRIALREAMAQGVVNLDDAIREQSRVVFAFPWDERAKKVLSALEHARSTMLLLGDEPMEATTVRQALQLVVNQ